jgi:hypothetical protein
MRNVKAVVLLGLALAAGSSAAAAPPIQVVGRSLATIYVDAGGDQGLQVGDRVRVVSGRTTVAEMTVLSVNAHAAACRVLSLKRPIARGDLVVPVRAASVRTAKADTTKVSSVARRTAPEAKAPPRPSATTPATAASGPAARPAPSQPQAPAHASATPSPAPLKVAERGLLKAAAEEPRLVKRSARSTASPSTDPASNGPTDTPPAKVVERGAEKTPAASPTPSTPREIVSDGPARGRAPSAEKTTGTARPPVRPPLPRPVFAALRETSSPSLASVGPSVAVASPAERSPAPRDSPASPPAPDPAPLSDRAFTVKYRSAASAYLDAGRAEGLDVGDRLRIVAGTTTIAELEVAYVAELSASCKVLSETRPVQAGDVARLVASPARTTKNDHDTDTDAAASETPAATAASAGSAAVSETRLAHSPSRLPWGRLRGAASFGYLRSWDRTASALDFQQRTARLDLGVDEIAGQPLSFRLRARSRQDVRARTLSSRTPRNERADRLYEFTLRFEPLGEPVAVELGRIGMYRFVGIGYLDGAIVRLRPRPGVQVGAFGGRRIEIAGSSFDGIGRSFGAFVRLAPAGRYVRGGYDVLLAYARDNAEGDISREYLSLESSFGNGSRWSLFQRAELDLNRGWRQELTGEGYQLSNVSLSGNLRLTRSAWAFLSYDGRRNYRYYRNRLVPEEVFDDLLHQGLRAGVNIARPGGFGATAGFGMSLKEPDPRHPELNIANAYSFNAGVRHANLFSSGLSAGLNGSGFTNGYADGGLVSANLGWSLGRGHMMDLSCGYSLYRVTQTAESRNTQWLRFLGRAQLNRWFYVLGDLEYDAGDDLEGPRIFLELGVLF